MNLSLTSILENLDIIEQNKKAGRMVAILLPPDEAQRALEAGKTFHSSKIEEDSTNKSDMHITLALIDCDTSPKDIVEVIKSLNIKPFTVSVRGTAYFDPSESSDSKHVLHAKILPKNVTKTQKIILKALQRSGIDAPDKWEKFGGYSPHVTLKYMEKPIKKSHLAPNFDFVCDKICLVDKKRKYIVRLKS